MNDNRQYYGQNPWQNRPFEPTPRRFSKRKVILLILIGALVAVVLFGTVIGSVVLMIKSQTKTEQYAIACAYIAASEDFKSLGVSEDALSLRSFSTGTTLQKGERIKYAEYGFAIEGTSASCEIELHAIDGGEWTVVDFDFDRH